MYRHLATKPGVQPVPGGAVAVPHRVVSVTVVTCGPVQIIHLRAARAAAPHGTNRPASVSARAGST